MPQLVEDAGVDPFLGGDDQCDLLRPGVGRSTGLIRAQCAANACQLVVLEEQRDALLGAFTVARFQHVDIVPAVLVKHVGDHR